MRRISAALVVLSSLLFGGVLPAFAQAPPPVAALPDTERRTSYSITAQTGPFDVGFAVYGDGTDYGNWIEVWLNGVRLTPVTGWTLALASGTLATAARPLTNARVTLTASATGTLQIVGARRPRRTSQFPENQGVNARSLNQVITDIIAQNREIWDKTNSLTGRAIISPPGETPFGTLPRASARASMYFCFDSLGAPATCSGLVGNSAFGITQPYANSSWFDFPTVGVTAVQNRLAGRVYIGAAVKNDGTFYPGGGPSAPNGFSNKDWFTKLQFEHFGDPAAPGVQSTGDFAQLFVLTDPDSAIALNAFPYPAIAAAATTVNSPTGATPRAIDTTCVNMPAMGNATECWGGYTEAHRLNANASHTWGWEFEVRNSATLVTFTPYTFPFGGTVANSVSCGAGLDFHGQINCTASHFIGANAVGGNIRFQTGILFTSSGIAASGPGGTTPAIALPSSYNLVWYKPTDALSSTISGDSSGNFNIVVNGGFIQTAGGGINVLSGNVTTVAGSFVAVDNAGLVWGDGSTFIGGNSSTDVITFNTVNLERARFKATGVLNYSGLAADPSGAAGDLYYNSVSNAFRFHNGSAWTSFGVTSAGTLTANELVIGQGGQSLATLGTLGTTTTVLHGNAGGAPTFSAVSLTADITGTLAVANGGTNCAAATITCFNNITGFSASGTTGTTSTNLVFSGAPTLTTSVTVPLVIGGSGTTGTQLTFKTTTGNGTTDQFAFVGGNNGGTSFGTWDTNTLTVQNNISALTGSFFVSNAGGLLWGAGSAFIAGSSASNFVAFNTGSTERGRWNNSGLQINTISNESGLTSAVCINGSGTILKGTTSTGQTCAGTSAREAKQDIERIGDALSILVNLDPSSFRYRQGYNDNGKRVHFGFIADEVLPHLPNLVGLAEDERPISVDMGEMVPMLVRSVQQLRTANDNLHAANDNMRHEFEQLKHTAR